MERHLPCASCDGDLSDTLRWCPSCVQKGNRHQSTVSESKSQSKIVVVVGGYDAEFLGRLCGNLQFFAARV